MRSLTMVPSLMSCAVDLPCSSIEHTASSPEAKTHALHKAAHVQHSCAHLVIDEARRLAPCRPTGSIGRCPWHFKLLIMLCTFRWFASQACCPLRQAVDKQSMSAAGEAPGGRAALPPGGGPLPLRPMLAPGPPLPPLPAVDSRSEGLGTSSWPLSPGCRPPTSTSSSSPSSKMMGWKCMLQWRRRQQFSLVSNAICCIPAEKNLVSDTIQ